jgi:hypothetical protein
VAATERLLATLGLVFGCACAHAATLPEDRADILYHGYDGGGLEVTGPSVLVRKAYQDKVSVWGNYYVDMISSASIDVVTTASEYSETRIEKSAGADYLHDRTIMGFSYTNSEEDDYSANLASFGISQSFFGDLTTLGISYARGWDEVRRNGDDTFEEDITRQNFRVDLAQVVTRSLLVSANYEGITDEGFLNNPYRQVRYQDPESSRGFSYEPEIYPDTKTSNAFALRALYYLPYRAALRGEFRRYSDTWEVEAWNIETGYVHPFAMGITAEVRYRYYDQSAAEFYSDLFPRQAAQNFRARDKELATFTSHTLGAGLSWAFGTGWAPLLQRAEASLFVDWLKFDYEDFRDVRVTDVDPGTEPLYELDAWVIRAFVSVWF